MHEEREGDHGRDRIAGQGEEVFHPAGVGKAAKDNGLAGLDRRSGEKEFSAQGEQRFSGEVIFADRNTPGEQQQVGVHGHANGGLQVTRIIEHERETNGLSTRGAYLGGQRVAVGVANLVG